MSMKTKDRRVAQALLPVTVGYPPLGTARVPVLQPNLLGPRRGSKKKLDERTGNVYENKGPVWQFGEPTGNLYENTDT
jgi:hypothetical protein